MALHHYNNYYVVCNGRLRQKQNFLNFGNYALNAPFRVVPALFLLFPSEPGNEAMSVGC